MEALFHGGAFGELESEDKFIRVSVMTGTRMDGLGSDFWFPPKTVWFVVRPADPWGLPTPNTIIEVL